MSISRKKRVGEAIRGFLNSPLWTEIILPEIETRKKNHLYSANLNVEVHAFVSKSLGAHQELVSLQEWFERKEKDADLDLNATEDSGPVITQD
jgi:hypothetical protein